MEFEVIGTISDIEIIAVGKTIRELGRAAPRLWIRPLEETQGARLGPPG